MAKDDYTAPLGLYPPHPHRRRVGLFALSSAAVLLLVCIFAGWALFVRNPLGGQPHVLVDLPVLPPTLPAAATAVPPPMAATPEAPLETPDQSEGEIIIRDP